MERGSPLQQLLHELDPLFVIQRQHKPASQTRGVIDAFAVYRHTIHNTEDIHGRLDINRGGVGKDACDSACVFLDFGCWL